MAWQASALACLEELVELTDGLPGWVRTQQSPPRMTLAGALATGEPCDLFCRNEQERQAQVAQLVRLRQPLLLPRLPATSPTLSALQAAFSGRGLVLVRPALGTPVIPLDESWCDPLSHFNAGRRSDFRRAQRHADKLGTVTFETHTQVSGMALDALLDEAYDVESRSWKGDEGTALQADPVRGRFFRHLAHAVAAEGQLYLAFMRIDGVAVAMQLAVVHDHALWLLKIGYDATVSRCSPGSLLMLHTLADAAQRGWRRYEFLGSPAPWTAVWTDILQPHVLVRCYPWSWRGAIALGVDLKQMLQGRLSARHARQEGASMIKRLLAPLRQGVFRLAEPVLRRASQAYVPGPKLDDALAMARRIETSGMSATIGYFDGEGDAPDLIEHNDVEAVKAVSQLAHPSYASIKVPSLGYDVSRIARIADVAETHGQIMHLDSHAPDTAEPTLKVLDALRASHTRLSLTIPGRWARSPADADWAVQHGIRVRVVKGQWPCAEQPDLDPATGFLAVIDRLAGKAPVVAVATHDAGLARESCRRLLAAGTRCELELLCGLPQREVLAVAQELKVPVRFYIPFGSAWLPYALGQLIRKPHMWSWMIKDLWLARRHA